MALDVARPSSPDRPSRNRLNRTRPARAARGPAVLTALACAAAGLVPAGASAAEEGALDRVLVDPAITESSGLARSTYRRGVVWTHNDSGDGPRVFAVGKDGRTRAVVELAGASAYDWEDMASGPGHSLWVGDIGDNAARRSTVSVYRFREPERLADRTVTATRFTLVYPGGPRDAEGLMVRPSTGRLFVVSKSWNGGALYRAPKHVSSSGVNRLTRVAAAPAVVTAAGFAPNSRRFVLTDYTRSYFYPRVGASPTVRTSPATAQGESVDFTRGGGYVVLGSEGTRSPVYRVPAP